MNHLYYGDNLRVLREHIADESVDLVYLDPPFNSNASYNVLFKAPDGVESGAQIEAFGDTWEWGSAAEEAFAEVLHGPNSDAAEMLRAMRQFLGENAMMAYLAMMAVRLIELHRVLKPTGSLYLHCDPTASHYLKILLDAVFGAHCFKNEIDWKRTTTHSDSQTWSNNADCILFYARREKGFTWNTPREVHSAEYIKSKYGHGDGDGRGPYHLHNMTSPSPRPKMMYDWKGFPHPEKGWRYQKETMQKLHDEGRIYYPVTKSCEPDTKKRARLKRYLSEMAGGVIGDIWTDIYPVNSQAQERLGYPTQKPVALLERIVAASSNPGDVVLDPFCGCGTTVHAAEKLGRRWIGIDVTHLAIGLIQRRLGEAFGLTLDRDYELHGTPRDLPGAQALAEADKHQFELWAVSLIPNAQPWKGGRKGADQGRDGILYVQDAAKKPHPCIIEVKGGAINDGQIRSLIGAMERMDAPMGLFVTLRPPTKPMLRTAAAAGFWNPGFETGQPIPRVQIVTIEDLLTSPVAPIRLPLVRTDSHRRAAREARSSQGSLDL